MIMFTRYYQGLLDSLLQAGRVLVLYGPRRVGKTFLLNQYLENYEGKAYVGTGEDRLLRETFESESVERIKTSFTGYDLVVVDEAQHISGIGLGLKMLVDHIPEAKVIATGSSSFDLANQVGEPLTGRKLTCVLYPLSVLELKSQYGPMQTQEMLETLLVYGAYPETLTQANIQDKMQYLTELKDSYLCRDILELDGIRNSRKLLDLLNLLAYQIGGEVSLNELGTALSMSKPTVSRYLDLLEKAFVIRRVRGYSGNLRKEVTKTSRYYFLDNGVRNAVINNFNPLSQRGDVGQLWENFLVMERMKKRHYTGLLANDYFWRTYDRQEIDLVEEREGKLFAFEFKYSPNKPVKAPQAWSKAYPEAGFSVVHRQNFLSFIS